MSHRAYGHTGGHRPLPAGAPGRDPALKSILEAHAKETLGDQEARRRIRRGLEPVRRAIREGRFDRRRRFGKPTVAALAAAVAVVAAVLFPAAGTPRGTAVIEDANVPLAAAARGSSLEGRVYDVESGGGVAGVTLLLMGADGMETYDTAVTGEDGVFRFAGVADGAYRVRAALPDGAAFSGGETSAWLPVGDDGRLVVGAGDGETAESIDVPVVAERERGKTV